MRLSVVVGVRPRLRLRLKLRWVGGGGWDLAAHPRILAYPYLPPPTLNP